jgi:hypothetical protein
VSGRLSLISGLAKVTVSGQGARGRLVIQRSKRFTTVKGTLDGTRLSIKTRTSPNDANVASKLPGLLGLNLSPRSISR